MDRKLKSARKWMGEVKHDWPLHLCPLTNLTSVCVYLSVLQSTHAVSLSLSLCLQIWMSVGWSRGLVNTGAWTHMGVTSATASTATCWCLTGPVEVSLPPESTRTHSHLFDCAHTLFVLLSEMWTFSFMWFLFFPPHNLLSAFVALMCYCEASPRFTINVFISMPAQGNADDICSLL